MSDRFRLRAKKIFLTFPQCENLLQQFTNNEHIFDYVEEYYRPHGFDRGVVAIEHHEDGNRHLHIVLVREHTEAITSERFFDLGQYHPNIQPCRNLRNAIKYVKKEDNYHVWGDLEVVEKRTMASRLLDVVSGTMSLDELINEHPHLIRGYKRLKEDIEQYSKDVSILSLQDSPSIRGIELPGLLTWRLRTKFKTPSLYIWGPPDSGKTSMLLGLGPRAFWAPMNNDWYGLDQNFHELIIFDEFRGAHLVLSVLLQLMAGNPLTMNTKGGSIRLSKKINCIFTSNIPPDEIFKDSRDSNAFLSRIFSIQTIGFQKFKM